MTYETFEDFMNERFDRQFTGIKDQYEDASDRWFSTLDVQEVMDYAETYGKFKYNDGQKDMLAEVRARIIDPVAVNVLTENK